MKDLKIAIVGVGLIGGSIALKLKALGYNYIYGIDIDKEVLTTAQKKGIIREGYTNGQEILKKSDIVFICLYPGDVLSFLKANHKYFKAESVLTDVTGLKTNYLDQVEKIIPTDVCFISGHPMAGKEKPGLDSADKELFNGANYILIEPINKNGNTSKVVRIIQKLGCQVHWTDAQQHDQMVAYTSQLPHILSVLIMSFSQADQAKAFAGNSFEEFTRISDINEKLWRPVFIKNKDKISPLIDQLIDALECFKGNLEQNKIQQIDEILIRAKKRRREYLKK